MSNEWLNGWKRYGDVIYMLQPHCAGCGKSLGVICIAIEEGTVYPNEYPDFPFEDGDCPVCETRNLHPRILTPEELSSTHDIGTLRRALAIKKGVL